MTRSTLVRSVFGVLLAVQLAACGGNDTGVDEAGAQAGASTAEGADAAGAPSEGADEEADDEGAPATGGQRRPGGPGVDPEGGGGEDDEDRGNPGAPGDVAIFEEAGVEFSVLRRNAASKCAGGVCRLLPPVVVDGDPDDVGGVDACRINRQSDISYDPPAEGGFFQKGATVTARVDCDPGNDNPDGGNPDGGDPDGGDPDGGDPDGGDPDGGDPDGGNPDGGNPDGWEPEDGEPEGDTPTDRTQG